MKNQTITKAMGDLWTRDAVLGAIIAGMEIVSDNHKTSTMSTNGRKVYINDKWAKNLTRNQAGITLAHEALHVARGHTIRRGSINPKTWNIAGDMAINHELRNWPGFVWLVNGFLTAEKANLPEGRSAEEYAKMLQKKEDKQEKAKDEPQNQSQDNNDEEGISNKNRESENGDDRDSGGDDKQQQTSAPGEVFDDPEPDKAVAEVELEQRLMEAITAAEQAGCLPSWAQELKATITAPPRLDWKRLLRRWLTQRAKVRQTFERPSRRQAVLGGELIHPGKGGRKVGHVAVLVDVSGSMALYARLLEQAVAEIRSLGQTMPGTEVTVIQWSNRVVSSSNLKRITEWKWQIGGGTMIANALAEATKIRADVCVVWTDGDIYDIPEHVRIPTLWCIVASQRTMPKHLGETIMIY